MALKGALIIIINDSEIADRRKLNAKFSVCVFAPQIVRYLFPLNLKLQTFSYFFVAVQPGLCQTWSENHIVGFHMDKIHVALELTKLF